MTFPKPGQKSHRLQVRHAAEKERVFFHFFGSETTYLEFNQDECTVQTYNPLVSQKHVLLYSSWCARRGHLRSEETHKILSETKLHTRMPRTYTTTQPKGREGDHEFCDPFKLIPDFAVRKYMEISKNPVSKTTRVMSTKYHRLFSNQKKVAGATKCHPLLCVQWVCCLNSYLVS